MLSSKTHRSIRVHSDQRFDAFSNVHTETFKNDRIAHCKFNSVYLLQTHTPAIYSVLVFIFIRFRTSVLIGYVFVLALIHFQERFQIHAVLMKTLSVLVGTEGLNALVH